MKHFLIILVFIVSIINAKSLSNAVEFYYDGKYKKAAYIFEYLAKRGNSKASLYLANMYFVGSGVVKNHKRAFEYYKKAAKKGHKSAQLKLSVLYLTGNGGIKSAAKANYWQHKAKQKSYAKAYFNFAKLDEKKKRYRAAFYWYKKAAKLDHSRAIFNVGLAFLHGNGVRKNYKQAKKFLRLAYFKGIVEAKAWINKYNLKKY